MKNSLFALFAALLLTSCAGVHVTKTYVATGAANPKNIYIRPFEVTYADFKGIHSNTAEREIRKSLAPREFADDLQEELSKLAPSLVLERNEVPTTGWLLEGEFVLVTAGNPYERALNIPGFGQPHILIHVRVIDVNKKSAVADAKGSTTSAHTSLGPVIYEFDIEGGSRSTGIVGTATAPGLGCARPFDFRNAAERIYATLSTDPHRYGVRSSLGIR